MVEITNKTRSSVSIKKIKQVIEFCLQKFNKIEHDLSVVLVGDVTMRRLNREYRHKDYSTDVLSFDGDNGLLGEIILNYAQIKRQAKKSQNSQERELLFMAVHGTLHLLGYNDKLLKDADKMNLITENILCNFKK